MVLRSRCGAADVEIARSAAPVTGYLHPGYARALGQPLWLEQAAGWLLERPIDGGPRHDLAAPYPLFFCRELAAVERDLKDPGTERPVSVVLITDPFLDASVPTALAGFDRVRPFKSHFVAPLHRPWRSFCRRSHRRYARRARRELAIRRVEDPVARAGEFWRLYREVAGRHRAATMTREVVTAHFGLPGLTLFKAVGAGGVLGLASYMEVEDRVYAHLIATSSEGRRRYATHGLYAAALDHYQERAAALDFGGNAGPADDPEDGLSRFKQGWSAEARTAYLCAKILDRKAYDALCAEAGIADTSSYFPAYRASEL